MSLKYERPPLIFQLKSNDGKILYSVAGPLLSRCKYIKNLYTQSGNELTTIELPFKAKSINTFLTYLNQESWCDEENDESVNKLIMLKSVYNVCLVADYLECNRFKHFMSKELPETVKLSIDCNLIMNYTTSITPQTPFTWKSLYEIIDIMIKRQKKS